MTLVKKFLTLGLSLAILGGSSITGDAYYTKAAVNKIAGKDNYETAALIADKQTYKTAIIVNLDNSIADGLSASGLSGSVNAPILLTKKDSIPDVTISRLNKAKKVYIIGGLNSVSASVENSLKGKGMAVTRIQGSDRMQTSLNVAKEIKKHSYVNYVFYTNGYKGEADAISIASVAARDRGAVILTDGKNTTYKNETNADTYVIGGSSSMSESFVQKVDGARIGGKDRFDTNIKIFNAFWWEGGIQDFVGDITIADGNNLVPGLISLPLGKEAPLILASKATYKSSLEMAHNITIIGNIDKDIENDLLNRGKIMSQFFGRYGGPDGEYYITFFNVFDYSYDILKSDRNGTEIKINYPDGSYDKQILRIEDTLVVHYYDDYTGTYDSGSYYFPEAVDYYISRSRAEQIALENCAKRTGLDVDDLIINYSTLDVESFSDYTYDVRIDNKSDRRLTYGHFFVNPSSGKVYKDIWSNTYWD